MLNCPFTKQWGREGIKSNWMPPDRKSEALIGKQWQTRARSEAGNVASEYGGAWTSGPWKSVQEESRKIG